MVADSPPQIETDIKPLNVSSAVGDTKHKVLIATLHSPDPVILACTRLGPDKLYLLVDKDPPKEQVDAFDLIKSSLGKVMDVKEVKVEPYDVVGVAKRVVELIDTLDINENDIFANITAGRKTKAIGLLFACYARHEAVKRIAYNPEEDKKSIVWLPRLSFHLTDSQKMILEQLDKSEFSSIKDLADKLEGKLSSGMVYRAIDELKDMDLVETEPKIGLTDAGRIARL